MAQQKRSLQTQLLNDNLTPKATQTSIQFHQTQYKQYGSPPSIPLSGLSLVILCPILLSLHLLIAKTVQIPIIQYSFVTLLVAFIVNYTMVIRKYQLMPYLPEEIYDNKLKKACIYALAGILISIIWGWNGSGGIIFAILWEQTKGNKMGTFGYLYAVIIIGCLMMQKTYTLLKLVQFIPGILYGMVSSHLFTLKLSSTYAIAHQFIFLASICIPMFFPASSLIVPTLFQWLIMLVTGITILITIILTIKLMQSQRVSIVMGVMSGIVMIGTMGTGAWQELVGAGLIVAGILFVLKKEYFQLEY